MLGIVIDVLLALLLVLATTRMAYLGVHVTLHPLGEEDHKQKTRMKRQIIALAVIIGLITVVQGIRNGLSTAKLDEALAKLDIHVGDVAKNPPRVEVNVPPAQVIIQQPAGNRSAPSLEAFLQLGPIIPIDGQNRVAANETLGFQVVFENKSTQLALDTHNWEEVMLVDVTTPAGEKEARQRFKKDRLRAHEESIKAKAQGKTIGIGQQYYKNTQVPITQLDYDSMTQGKKRVMLQAWASWKDSSGTIGVLDECWYVDPPYPSPLTISNTKFSACK
ncbi:MAG TPA: hypothetical protein VFK06_23430 [Candidatus Angelobacter sp.]|nr:hypothetical protein [Candidatus Angelobacter sp.]